jgi:hypothetical protein
LPIDMHAAHSGTGGADVRAGRVPPI